MSSRVVPKALTVLIGIMLTTAARAVDIIVSVPSDTPPEADLFLASSMSGWRPDGLKLARQPDGTFAGNISLEVGQAIEFKITRGSWDTVEKRADGSERENRTLTRGADTQRIRVVVEAWSKGPADVPSTVVGRLELVEIESRHLATNRMLRIWLPEGYGAEAGRRYPVLYMHDGQNLFDRKTSAFGNEWQIDETLTKRIADGSVPPLIVVGIDNSGAERINEYTFDADVLGGGKGAQHERFLIEEVIPFINDRYLTQRDAKHTYIGGSSLGGIVSLELAMRHPQTFSGVIAMSPALWWAKAATIRHLQQDGDQLKSSVVYLDIGTREGLNNDRQVEFAREAQAVLAAHEVIHKFVVAEGAQHNEAVWAGRFGDAIVYLTETSNGRN